MEKLALEGGVLPNEKAAVDISDLVDTGIVIAVERIRSFEKKPGYDFAKRIFDFVFAAFALIVLLLPMLVIAAIIRTDSEGPALYKQERLGLNGKKFKMHKFRSMHTDAEKNGARWASKNDGRITRVGRVLRGTRMDELPQLLDILAGHMSFVGPRPEREVYYDLFEKNIDGFGQRLFVKPGLTGWAQINGGYELRPAEKIIYDIEYIKNRSLWFDLKCVIGTFRIVFLRDGAR